MILLGSSFSKSSPFLLPYLVMMLDSVFYVILNRDIIFYNIVALAISFLESNKVLIKNTVVLQAPADLSDVLSDKFSTGACWRSKLL